MGIVVGCREVVGCDTPTIPTATPTSREHDMTGVEGRELKEADSWAGVDFGGWRLLSGELVFAVSGVV